MANKILVVDDEKPIQEIMKFNLTKEGYDVVTASDGQDALDQVEKNDDIELILLDLMLPEIDGLEVARRIRADKDTPIIMVSAKGSEIDKVIGLEMGADDYITKPFSNRELIARVKANLRRSHSQQQENNDDGLTKKGKLKIHNLVIDPDAYSVTKNGELVELTHREFELLYYLAQHPGQVLNREHLLKTVWGYDYFGDVRTVDVTVRRLREKIENVSSKPNILKTKRGVGYYFVNEETE